jgi:hypothetical protein
MAVTPAADGLPLAPDPQVQAACDGAVGALLATGSDRFDAVLGGLHASGSAWATLRAIKPHCPDRLALVEACGTAALAGRDDAGVAAFLREEGIHPLSVRLALTDTRSFPHLKAEAVVERLDVTLGIRPRFRLAAENMAVGEKTLLQELPDGLVTRRLNLACGLLEALPADLEVMDSAQAWGCEGLTHIGDHLKVGGDLRLNGCVALRALPCGLVVKGTLDIRGCTALTNGIPGDAVIEGSVTCDGFIHPMSLDAYRQLRAWAPTGGERGRKTWEGLLANGAGVRNAVTALFDQEDPALLATWALEVVQEEPFEVMASLRELISGKRNLAPYVAALRAAGIHPLSLATTAMPGKGERIAGLLGAGEAFGNPEMSKCHLRFVARGLRTEILAWRPDGLFEPEDQGRALIVMNGLVGLRVLPSSLPPLWAQYALSIEPDEGTAWMTLPAGTRCLGLVSDRIRAAQGANGMAGQSMTLEAFAAWRMAQGWTEPDGDLD